MALALYWAGRYEEADNALQRLSGSTDRTVLLQVAYNRGNCAYRLGSFARAADLYFLTVQQCLAEPTESRAGRSAERAALLPELLKRAEYNLALARARGETAAKAEHRTSAGRTASERVGAGSGGGQASSESAAAPGQPNPAEQATGNSPGTDAGTRSVEAVLSSVTSRDTGPVLKPGKVRTASPTQGW